MCRRHGCRLAGLRTDPVGFGHLQLLFSSAGVRVRTGGQNGDISASVVRVLRRRRRGVNPFSDCVPSYAGKTAACIAGLPNGAELL